MMTIVGLFLLVMVVAWSSKHVSNVFENKERNRKQEHRDTIDVGKIHLKVIQDELRYEESLAKRKSLFERDKKALAQQKLLAKKALSEQSDLLSDEEKEKLQNFIEG